MSYPEHSWVTQLELVHFPNFYLCIYTHPWVHGSSLLPSPYFPMRTKSLKFRFHGSLPLATVTFTNLQSHTMSVISHTLCKFVFAHQNLRDYKLILPFNTGNLAKPFLPSAVRRSFVSSNFISLISAETLSQKFIFWSELQLRKRKGESGLRNLDLVQFWDDKYAGCLIMSLRK